jgi:hypothetical protein
MNLADLVKRMKLFLLLPAAALSLGFTLPFGHQQHMSRSSLERTIAAQMNGSPAGRITRTVSCKQLGLASGTTRYRCTLTGMTGTHEHLLAIVDGGSWRADWAPLNG